MNLDLTKQSDSTIIVLIIVLVSAFLAMKPIIKIWIAAKDKYHDRDIEQQDKLIAVIQSNTEVNASLKTLLEEDSKHCADCRTHQIGMFQQLQDNQDIANMKLVEIQTILKKEE